ncbi:MAG: SDR family oxidoreductase [Erysipelotrichaceae bacterium]|nr:SDR family oxidoreductase [Erysipelotrichaceae bacterium]
MFDVKGRYVFISGASRGIGYQAAVFMAEQGCKLILHARKKEHLQKILDAVKVYDTETYTVEAELSDLLQVELMLKKIDSFGVDVDIVLNNAGIQVGYRNDYLNTPIEDYEESFRINTIAPMMITYHFLKKREKKGYGRIINTTSGIRREPQQAGYSASKAALDKVTMDLASVYDGSNIMINLTDPGWCKTDLGGQNAPNTPESTIPGIVVGAFVDDQKSGRLFAAPAFHGMSIAEAVQYAEKNVRSYCRKV